MGTESISSETMLARYTFFVFNAASYGKHIDISFVTVISEKFAIFKYVFV